MLADDVEDGRRSDEQQGLTVPFTVQRANGTGAVLSPEAAAGSLPRGQWLLSDRATISCDRRQYRNRSAVPSYDRGTAFLGRVEKLGQPAWRYVYGRTASHLRSIENRLCIPATLSLLFHRIGQRA